MSTYPSAASTANYIYEDARLNISLTRFPTTLGHTVVTLQQPATSLFSCTQQDFIAILLTVRKVAATLCAFYHVHRCALITGGLSKLSILPLHGLSEEWEPVTSHTKDFHETFPGYITTEDAPQIDSTKLQMICTKIQAVSGVTEPYNYHFDGDKSDQNLFARLIRGEIPQSRIWESETHIAFLTPFGNTPGFTVVVPRRHLSSDIFALDDESYSELLSAAYLVAGILRQAFAMERCGMIFEGFEIDYAHVKLIPIHEEPKVSANDNTNQQAELVGEYQENYQGYVTSLDGPAAEDVQKLSIDAAAIQKLLHTNGN